MTLEEAIRKQHERSLSWIENPNLGKVTPLLNFVEIGEGGRVYATLKEDASIKHMRRLLGRDWKFYFHVVTATNIVTIYICKTQHTLGYYAKLAIKWLPAEGCKIVRKEVLQKEKLGIDYEVVCDIGGQEV